MSRTLTILALAIAAITTCSTLGCRTPDRREVTRDEMTQVQESIQRVSVGMPREEVLKVIPPFGYRNLVGTTTVEGGTLEEWVLEAILYDAAARFWYSREVAVETFRRYFYFVDNVLADMSREPLQYRDRLDLVVEWRNR